MSIRRYNPLNVGSLKRKLQSYYRNPSDRKRRQLEDMLQKAITAMQAAEEAMSHSTRSVINLFKEFLEHTEEEDEIETPPVVEEIIEEVVEKKKPIERLSLDELKEEVGDIAAFFGDATKAADILSVEQIEGLIVHPATGVQLSNFLKGSPPRRATLDKLKDSVLLYREYREKIGHLPVSLGTLRGENLEREILVMLAHFKNNTRAAARYLGPAEDLEPNYRNLRNVLSGKSKRNLRSTSPRALNVQNSLKKMLSTWWGITAPLITSVVAPPPAPPPAEDEEYQYALKAWPELAKRFGPKGGSMEELLEITKHMVDWEGGFKATATRMGGGSDLEQEILLLAVTKNASEIKTRLSEKEGHLLLGMVEMWLLSQKIRRERMFTGEEKEQGEEGQQPIESVAEIIERPILQPTPKASISKALKATANNPDKVFTFADFGIVADSTIRRLKNKTPEINIISSEKAEDPETGETINVGTFNRAGDTVYSCPVRHKYIRIAYATTEGGKQPARRGAPSWPEFYKSRKEDIRARDLFVRLFQRICESSMGKIQDGTLFKKVVDSGQSVGGQKAMRSLWEFKATNKDIKVRICCFMESDTIYLTNMFYKNKPSADLTMEYSRGVRIMNEHLARQPKSSARRNPSITAAEIWEHNNREYPIFRSMVAMLTSVNLPHHKQRGFKLKLKSSRDWISNFRMTGVASLGVPTITIMLGMGREPPGLLEDLVFEHKNFTHKQILSKKLLHEVCQSFISGLALCGATGSPRPKQPPRDT